MPGRILHTVFERPYEIILEKIFGVISKNLYKDLKKFNLGNDIIETIYGDTTCMQVLTVRSETI